MGRRAAVLATLLALAASPVLASPVVKLIGFETRDASEIVSLGAGATINATVRPGSGVRSLRQSTTASVLASGITPALNTLGLRFSFLKPSNPGAAQTLVLLTTGATSQWALQLTAGGLLQLQDLAGLTFSGTTVGATALVNATWYTIRLAYDAAAGGTLQVWLDGSLEISITHTGLGTAVDQIQVLAAAALYNYDDFYLADTATQPPLGQIVRIAVNGPGYRSDFDTTVSANRELNVDEPNAPSDTDYNRHAAATVATDFYALQSSPAGTITAVKGMWRMRGSAVAVGGTHDYAWRVQGIEASQDFTGLDASWTLKEVVWSSPPGVGGSWTQAQVDGLELGARHNGTHAEDTDISWTAAMVDYIAGPAAPGPSCGEATKPWFNPSWQYRRALRVDHTKVVGDLVDFPMLVTTSADTGLATHARPDGFDILFTDDDGTTQLSYQREAYDGAGNLVAWVKVPLLPTGVDKVVFMYYGNPSSTDQQSVNPTWSNGYQAVWHLSEASGAGAYIRNSALNNYHGTPSGTAFNGSGKIDGARTFSRTATSYVDIGGSTGTLFHRWTQFSFEFWVYPDYASDAVWEAAGEDQVIYGDTGPLRLGRVRRFNYNPAGTGEFQMDVQFNSAGIFYDFDSINRRAWNHVVFTYQGSDFQVFFNGVETGRDLVPNDRLINAAYFLLGNNSGALNGSLDEVRVSSAGRSSEWVLTEYANQNAPASFCSVCFEQDVVTTAVRLMSFEALGADHAVDLQWRTGSELDNLGFHLYRAASADGPWTRITPSLVPGLGTSALGASYSWRDEGLINGQVYFYRLEDVDTASVSTFHGPASAVPDGSSGSTTADPPAAAETDPPGRTGSCPAWVRETGATSATSACVIHGDPRDVSLRIVSRTERSLVVELHTGGFVAVDDGSGEVRALVPGFDQLSDPGAPELPLRRALVDAVVGRSGRIVRVEASELEEFPGLRPAGVGYPELLSGEDGTVHASRRRVRLRKARGILPASLARLAGESFQGERKRLVLELSPLRWDAGRDVLVLAHDVRVEVRFDGVAKSERGAGSRGRRRPRSHPGSSETLAHLYATQAGLHAVAFETLLGPRGRALDVSTLRLTRRGEATAFHVEPAGRWLGPGSRLFFYVPAGPASTSYSAEVAFALERAAGGVFMATRSVPPTRGAVATSVGTLAFELDRIYQPALLEAEDPWLWESVFGGAAKTLSLTLAGVDSGAGRDAEICVFLQGGSDSAATNEDHHLRLRLNGSAVGELWFDGKRPYRFTAALPMALLREGPNDFTLENLGDTGVSSVVFLDRVELSFVQASALRGGRLDGIWQSGVARIAREPSQVAGDVVAVDVTDPSAPVWLQGLEVTATSVSLQVDTGRRVVVAGPEGVLGPRVQAPVRSTLRSTRNQADYLLIAPAAFLPAAEPLVERRRSQGLAALSVSLEEIASVFGDGEPSAEAIRDFLAFAYHEWRGPSIRYVLLLGDGSYDPRNFTGTAGPAPLPVPWLRTSYLWTASDPALAAVNGEDALPDLALGRLPAGTAAEAEALVTKLLDWEDSRQGLGGQVVLVADQPDQGGDFEADVEDLASSVLQGRPTQQIRVRELGGATRGAIVQAFDDGAAVMSYVGHGGSAVWSSRNVLNSWDVSLLRAQGRQPLMLTLNCLNGYFVAPSFPSLAEAFLKAEGRGTIAAVSPSGLSVDGPAHVFHRALLTALMSGEHTRLGDAFVAAQQVYAEAGLMPELVSVYHLFGDPALPIAVPSH